MRPSISDGLSGRFRSRRGAMVLLVMVLTVALSGCNVLTGESRPTDTLTPAPIPTVEDPKTITDGETPTAASRRLSSLDGVTVDVNATWNRTLALVDVNATRPAVVVANRTFTNRLPPFVFALTGANQDAHIRELGNYRESEGVVVISNLAVRELSASSLEQLLARYYVHAIQNQQSWYHTFQRDSDDPSIVEWITRKSYNEGITLFLQRQYVEQQFGARSDRDLKQRYENASTPRRYLLAPMVFGGRYFERRVNETENLGTVIADPPLSSEQLLHHTDEPWRNLTVDTASTADWSLGYSSPQGELGIRILLRDELTKERAIAAAEGWGADVLRRFESRTSNESGYVWVQRWDSIAEADEFETAIGTYLDRRRAETEAYAYAAKRVAPETTLVLVGTNEFVEGTSVEAATNASVEVTVPD